MISRVSLIRPVLHPRVAWVLALPLIFVGAASGEVRDRLSGVHIPFIANAGQTDPAVAYYAPTFAGTVFVTRDGRIVYSLQREKATASNRSRVPCRRGGPCGRQSPVALSQAGSTGWSLSETPLGGRVSPIGSQRASTNVSYFIGNDRSRWRSGLETFEGVSLGEVWPGIRLDLRARGKNVEKLFTVEPGRDPSQIRMRVNGARSLRLSPDGALVMRTDLGDLAFTPPLAFQERQGVRHPVRVAYRLRGNEYGFRLGHYDPALPVLIDPLVQATYLGGTADDFGRALAIHPVSGDVYVAGDTSSANFPGTTGGAQASGKGAFIARVNSSLTTLIQATLMGDGSVTALAVHPKSGDVYVTGFAGANLPGTTGGAQEIPTRTFVARLDFSLTTLLQATYLGGSGGDYAHALAIHPITGDVFVAGETTSNDFPGTSGGAQATYNGGDAFVARLNSSLTSLTQATYLGGNGWDVAQALAIHPTSGDVYVAGYTSSKDFPGLTGGAQAVNGGGYGMFGPAPYDAFVTRLSSSLKTLTQATYIGGNGLDFAYALAIHPTSGDVYVAGSTSSSNFPGTLGGAQAGKGGSDGDAFVARLNSSLTTLAQATYLGGSGSFGVDVDSASALAIHPMSGEVYVAGYTASYKFPGTAGGAQHGNGGGLSDAFAARLNSSLTTVIQATYLGGGGFGGYEGAEALAIHPTSGDVYVAGNTDSVDFPGTAGGAQPVKGAVFRTDAFVARLSADLAAGGCTLDATSLCLNGGRFKVQTRWMTPDGVSGAGQAVGLTANTGYFWFFGPNSVEVIVKVISGCGFNSRIWTFAAGLTNVNVVMTVTDTTTGAVKTYVNAQGTAFAPIQDTSAFATCSTTSDAGLSYGLEPAENLASAVAATAESAAACTTDATTLCLNGGRFKVQTRWMTSDGNNGAGQAVVMTPDTGSFWFFSPSSIEVVVKVGTGCGYNSRYWTFAGGLTDVNVVMTVTDTQTGAFRTYINPQGVAFQPIQDTSAFATCP